jgi:hypothetical protein
MVMRLADPVELSPMGKNRREMPHQSYRYTVFGDGRQKSRPKYEA